MTAEHRQIAVVGAGLAGLECARGLVAQGLTVTLFDKARGPGGRLTTRRRGEARFDHGAQYFTVRHPAFLGQVSEWEKAGAAAPWAGRFGGWTPDGFAPITSDEVRWVGTPRMSAIGRHLARGLDVRLGRRVIAIEGRAGAWALRFEDGPTSGSFQQVIVTCPGPQAEAILPSESPTHAAAAALEYGPCWAAMVTFDQAVTVPYDGIHFTDTVLGWAAREASKPGRAPGHRWVLHGDPMWSAAQLEVDPDTVQRALVDRFCGITGAGAGTATVHRWLYARAADPTGDSAVWDARRGLGLCGDALGAPRVEGAFLSGRRMSALVLETGEA